MSLILDPTNAEENQDYDDTRNEFQNELLDYESDDAFDGGKDLQD